MQEASRRKRSKPQPDSRGAITSNQGGHHGIFKSKKFTALFTGIIVLVLTQVFGFAEDAATEIATMIAAYVVGQGVADGFSQGKTSNVST